MKYEGDVNYADNPYGMPPQKGGRRGLLGLGLAVVGIVAFAGAILVTYGKSDHTSADGGPPLLTADGTPTKMRPEQPGGIEVPHQDKLVYERLNERGAKPNVERLLPPPEQPLPRPVVTPQMPPPPPLPTAPAVAQIPPPPPGATATVPRALPEGEPMPAPSAPPTLSAAVPPVAMAPPVPAAAPAAKPVAAAPPPVAKPPAQPVQTAAIPAAPPKPAPAPAAPATAPQAAKPPAAPPAVPAAAPQSAPQAPQQAAQPAAKTAGAGGWRVQLASVRSEAEAATEWKRLSSRYPGALGGLSMQVAKADLGEKGVYYRVQGVGMDEARAKAACAQLKAQNVGCVVVRP